MMRFKTLVFSILFALLSTGCIKRPEITTEPADEEDLSNIIDFVSVPSGILKRSDETPIQISGFEIGKTEITYKQWKVIYDWAILHGYQFDEGPSKFQSGSINSDDDNQPITGVSWYDAIKWCNAFSEYTKRTPLFYNDASRIAVYRTGKVNLSNSFVLWNPDKDGFRLPTESEWEWAYLGGATNNYFWGFNEGFGYPSPAQDYLWYIGNSDGESHTVSDRLPNFYQLHDMAGNVWEWTWDNYNFQMDTNYSNPRGYDVPGVPKKVLRGGAFLSEIEFTTVSYRKNVTSPAFYDNTTGFRIMTTVR